jgi:tetratricopeptide (TPR) repeat protein
VFQRNFLVKYSHTFNFKIAFILLFLSVSCHNPDKKNDDKSKGNETVIDTSTLEKKLADINEKIKANPKNADLFHQRALIGLSQKDLNAALEDMTRALNLDSTKASYYMTIADVYFAANKTRFTKDALEKAISLEPKNVEAILKLAELYLFVENYKTSVQYIDDALKIDVTNPKAYFMKGMDFKAMGDTNKAVSSFKTAIEQNPKYYEAFMQLGLLFSAKHDKLALQYFNSAITLHSQSTEAYYARAFFNQENGDIEQAIQDYNIILQIDPKYKYAHFNLGYLNYNNAKDYDKAIKNFTSAIESDPKYINAYYWRALCYENKGNRKAASDDYQKVLNMDPDNDLADKGYKRMTK